jgi:hypothetical protein
MSGFELPPVASRRFPHVRTIGVAMSLIKKCDIENYRAARRHKRNLLNHPPSLPDGTGFSGADSSAIKAIPSEFGGESLLGHSSSGAPVTPDDHLTGSISPQTPAAPRIAEA